MVKARKIVYVNHFDGEPKPTDFHFESEVLPELKDGGRILLLTYKKKVSMERNRLLRVFFDIFFVIFSFPARNH